MTFTCEMPDSISIGPVKKTGRTYTVDMKRIVESGMLTNWLEGCQKLTDALSGYSLNGSDSTVKATPDEMHQVVCDTLEAVYAGEWRRRGGGRIGDPVLAEMMDQAIAYFRKHGGFKSAKEKDVRAFINENPDKRLEPFRAKAEKVIAARQEDDGVVIDLG